jgi:hypothetical protein
MECRGLQHCLQWWSNQWSHANTCAHRTIYATDRQLQVSVFWIELATTVGGGEYFVTVVRGSTTHDCTNNEVKCFTLLATEKWLQRVYIMSLFKIARSLLWKLGRFWHVYLRSSISKAVSQAVSVSAPSDLKTILHYCGQALEVKYCDKWGTVGTPDIHFAVQRWKRK